VAISDCTFTNSTATAASSIWVKFQFQDDSGNKKVRAGSISEHGESLSASSLSIAIAIAVDNCTFVDCTILHMYRPHDEIYYAPTTMYIDYGRNPTVRQNYTTIATSINNCNFTGGLGMAILAASAADFSQLTVSNCTFAEIDSGSDSSDYDVTAAAAVSISYASLLPQQNGPRFCYIDNCTFTNSMNGSIAFEGKDYSDDHQIVPVFVRNCTFTNSTNTAGPVAQFMLAISSAAIRHP
jgi:hypothetical protein